jgi:hypothetical protein
MKISSRCPRAFLAGLAVVTLFSLLESSATAQVLRRQRRVSVAPEQQAATYKMTTPLPPGIASPAKVETRLGTLKFFDGFPDQATTDKLYDNLDFQP